MENKHTVLILGGGVGGLVTARLLRKKLPKNIRVVLVDRLSDQTFAPSLLWLMTGHRKEEKITKSLNNLYKKGIEYVQGEIKSINPETREVKVDETTLKCDHLVIALGAELAPDTIPGLIDSGYNFYTLEGATKFRDAWKKFKSGKLVILTASPLYKCPAAPYEAAMLLEYDSQKKNIRDKIKIDLYAAEPGPMGVAGVDVSNAVHQMIIDKGINYFPEHQVTNVDPKSRKLVFSNNIEIEYDILAYVPPHRAPLVVHQSNLLGESGWVNVDRHTLETEYKEVYAIGDVTGIPLSLGKPLPKAGVFAHAHAEVVAHNILVKITGKGKPTRYNGYGACFIEIGGGKAGYGKGNFYGEPLPIIKLKSPNRIWHWGKVLFEKRWLRKWY